MADNAEAEKSAKKGRATTSGKKLKTVKEKSTKAKSAKAAIERDSLADIREQIENTKNELEMSLRMCIRDEYEEIVETAVRRANRRRHWSNFFHDIVIIAATAVAVYFGYVLYDLHYFNFSKTECEKNGTCETVEKKGDADLAGPVKDANWYLTNYGYLFSQVQTELPADGLDIYYLYSNDYKASELALKYRLAMAYNAAEKQTNTEQKTVEITTAALKNGWKEVFGNTEDFEKKPFQHGNLEFDYQKEDDKFVAKMTSSDPLKRKIVEKIEKIYEEGEVIYTITTAAIYDAGEESFYNFNNLFQPVAVNAKEDDYSMYTGVFNRYQYQFKKLGDKYYFAGATKIH